MNIAVIYNNRETHRGENKLTTDNTENVIHVDFGLDPFLNKGDFVKLTKDGYHGVVVEVKSRFEAGPCMGQAIFADIAVPIMSEDEEGEWVILDNVYIEDLSRVITKHPEAFDDLEGVPYYENDFNFEENDNG